MSEDSYVVTGFDDAHYVLFTSFNFLLPQSELALDYYGSLVLGFIINHDGRSYFYARVNQYMLPIAVEPLIMFSRHFMNDFSINIRHLSKNENVVEGVAVSRPNSVRHHNPKTLKNLNISKISGEHHIHFTAAEVWDNLDGTQRQRASLAFFLPPDVSTTFMAGAMLWLASASEVVLELVLTTNLFSANSVSDFMKYGKALSIRAKSYQNLVEADLREMFELEVLTNRGIGTIDWEEEKLHRTNPSVTTLSDEEVYMRAYQVLSSPDGSSDSYQSTSWKTFWESRWQWSAAGSIHTQYKEDEKYIFKHDRALKNKFISLIAMPNLDMSHFTDRKPSIQAWSSEKYEWGKRRPIYGTDLNSYIITQFAFQNVEDMLPAHFPIGKKARPSFVNARMQAVLKNTTPFCMDFADFNSMHSTGSMKAVLKAFYDVNYRYMSVEQRVATTWVIDSLDHVIINDLSGTGTTYKAQGTLLSGWRLTTFMNSILNYIYTMALVGKAQTTLRSVHNGDDVLLGIDNFVRVRDISKKAKELNITLQRSKSYYGGISEFLRVDHARGETGQYLARNISTLMHSRIESKIALSASDVVEAMEDRLAEYVTRGGSYRIAKSLRETYYARISQVFNTPEAVLWTIKNTHSVCGGISRRGDAEIKYKVVTEGNRASAELEKGLPGVTDYAMALIRKLQIDLRPQEVIDQVYSATIRAVQMVRKRVSLLPNNNIQQTKILRGLYKAHADVEDKASYGKAKMVGFAIDLISKRSNFNLLAAVVANTHDPLGLLKILT